MSSKERSFRRRLEKDQEATSDSEATLVPENHLLLPVGQVLTEQRVRGKVLAVPLLGWVAKRVRVQTPLVMVDVLLFNSSEDVVPCGRMRIEIPIFPETELGALSFLERLGWDGRVWPKESGWPDGDENEQESLKTLMAHTNLNNTLVFPPSSSGTSAVEVSVERAQGPFLMPSMPVSEEVKHLERFRELYSKPWT